MSWPSAYNRVTLYLLLHGYLVLRGSISAYIYIHMPNHRRFKKGPRGGNATCKKYHKKPLKCLSTPGCVYYSNPQQCKSKSHSSSYADSVRARARDYERNPDFYRTTAATAIQKTRRGHSVRKPAKTMSIEVTGMDGEVETTEVRASKSFKGFSRELSQALGHPAGDMKFFHPKYETPLSTIAQVKSLQAEAEDGVVRLFLMNEKADPMLALSVVQERLEAQGRQHITLELLEEQEEKADDEEEEDASGFRGATFTGQLVREPLRAMFVPCASNPTKVVPPFELGEVADMEELYFTNMLLTGLPEVIGNLSNLVYLTCYFTTLKSLPESIGRLSSLRSLKIKKSCLGNDGVPESLGDLTNLETLEITYPSNMLKINDSNRIGRTLARLPNLAHLDLSGCNLNGGFTLPSTSNLISVRLNNCNLQLIPDWVYYAPELSLLEARDNEIVEFRSAEIEHDEDGIPITIFPNLLHLDLRDAFAPPGLASFQERINLLRAREQLVQSLY